MNVRNARNPHVRPVVRHRIGLQAGTRIGRYGERLGDDGRVSCRVHGGDFGEGLVKEPHLRAIKRDRRRREADVYRGAFLARPPPIHIRHRGDSVGAGDPHQARAVVREPGRVRLTDGARELKILNAPLLPQDILVASFELREKDRAFFG